MAKSFNSTIEPVKNSLLIVDALNLGFRWKHSGDTDFVDDYIRTVDSLRKSYKCSHVVIACDQGSSSYRKAVYPGYKQARRDKFDAQTEDEKEAFKLFFQEFQRVLDTYINDVQDYPVLKFDKCEADDIAAYITLKRKALGISSSWLASSDKDWDLLVNTNVSRFSYVTRKEIREDNWSEFYDVPIDNLIDIKCLIGDSGDSVPGVPGIGPTRSVALVKQYGSTYDIAASLPISSRFKYIAALNEFGSDNLIRNFKLMDLLSHCEEALGEENCQTISQVMTEYLKRSY